MTSSTDDDKDIVSHALHDEPSRIQLAGDGDEYIIIGNKKYYRHELMAAFGGTMQPERLHPYQSPLFGNAAALGLASFALSTFVLGLFLSGAMGITIPNVVVGLCFFYGGLVEAAAGIWELFLGNTFAGTVLVSFGMGFWISFGAIYVEAFGIIAAYGDDVDQFNNAVGFYLIGWGIFTFLMLLCTLKSTFVFMSLFLTLDIAFFVLAAYYFNPRPGLLKAGGIFAVLSSFCGWFCAFAGTATPQNSYFKANPILIPVLGKKPQA